MEAAMFCPRYSVPLPANTKECCKGAADNCIYLNNREDIKEGMASLKSFFDPSCFK